MRSAGVFLASLLVLAAARSSAEALPEPTAAGYLSVERGRIYYEVFGSACPLVFIHDGLVHREVWDAQVAAFAPHYRVVRYDRRGYGRSEMPDTTYSNLEDLHALIEHLGIERAVILGSSAGGGLTIDYALAHPERVAALVLSGPVVNGLGYSLHFMQRGYANYSPDPAQQVENWIEDPYAVAPENPAAKARMRELLTAHPGNLSFTQHRWNREPEWTAIERLGEIRVPVLLLTGDRDIPDVHAHMGAIEAGIPGARRVVIPNAGHLCYLEQAEAWNAEVLEFLSLVSLGPDSPLLLPNPPEPWKTYERGFKIVNGAPLYYEAMGEGEPVILLHGGAIDHRMWDDEFARLARNFRVVRYDARGHGLSLSPFGVYRHFKDLEGLMRQLELQRAHLVGLSMGCRLAVDLAIDRPDMVASLTLLSPGISGFPFDSEETTAYMQRIGAAFGRGDFPQAAEEFVQAWCDGPKRSPEQTPPSIRQKVKSMAIATVRPDRDLAQGMELEPPAMGRLGEVRCPTLAVLGELDMPEIHSIVEKIQAEVPGARVERIPGAAHMVNMEEPERVGRLMEDFIRSH